MNKLLSLLYLRPNCLLTRKPIWVLTRTKPDQTPDLWARLRFSIFKWHIERHGYKIDPRSSWIQIDDWEHPDDAHELDYFSMSLFSVLDYLILLAEEDFQEDL